MTKRSDTLAAQVAALDMVMTAIDEGRDMRAFVGGMLTAAKDARDAALSTEHFRWDKDALNARGDEAEMDREDARLEIRLADDDLPGANDPIGGIDNGPCSDFAPDTLGDDAGVCTTCFYQGIDHHDQRMAEVFPVGTAYANRIAAALDAKDEAEAYAAWDGLGRPPTRAMREQAHDVGGPLYEEDDEPEKEPHAYRKDVSHTFREDDSCYYCGRPEDEHDEQPLELHGIRYNNDHRSPLTMAFRQKMAEKRRAQKGE